MRTLCFGITLLCAVGSLCSWAQGFHAVTRVTPMAPARGLFFGSQGIGPQVRVTPTVSTVRAPGPLVADGKARDGNGKAGIESHSERMDSATLAAIRKRASQGSVVDQYRMGLVFARGLAGTRDLKLARRWFAVAAHSRYSPAVVALQSLQRHENAKNKN